MLLAHRSNRSYWRHPVCLWPEHGAVEMPFDRHSIVEAEFITRRFDCLVGDLRYMDAADQLQTFGAINLLPRGLASKPETLDALALLIGQVAHPALREFVGQIHSDISLAEPFLSVPASLGLHHAYSGGLIVDERDVETELWSRY
jgi:hypothetical protein